MTRQTAKPHSIAVRRAFGFAWRTFKKRFGLFMGIVLTLCGAWVVLEFIIIAGQRFGIVWWAAAGLVLLVVPGLYLGARYAWFGFALVDGRLDMPRAFQHSAQVSEGAKFSLLAMIVWLVVFNMLGACLLGVGLFVTAPMSALMMAAVYRQLGGRRPGGPFSVNRGRG